MNKLLLIKEDAMFPWLQTHFNYPFSGNVDQKIEPDWFYSYIDSEVGDSEIEKEVFCKVASYGKQIGMLTEVLLSIADELKIDLASIQTLAELKEMRAKVEAVKATRKNRVRENAKSMLEKLKSADPEGLESLLREYGEK